MKKRTLSDKRKPRIRREFDPKKYCILTLLCNAILAGGLFLAATFHFSSINYGMKNAKLRSEIEELKSKKRRLLLLREISLSPSAIEKAAREIGLREVTPASIEVVSYKKPQLSELNTKQEIEIDMSVKVFKTAKTEKNKFTVLPVNFVQSSREIAKKDINDINKINERTENGITDEAMNRYGADENEGNSQISCGLMEKNQAKCEEK